MAESVDETRVGSMLPANVRFNGDFEYLAAHANVSHDLLHHGLGQPGNAAQFLRISEGRVIDGAIDSVGACSPLDDRGGNIGIDRRKKLERCFARSVYVQSAA